MLTTTGMPCTAARIEPHHTLPGGCNSRKSVGVVLRGANHVSPRCWGARGTQLKPAASAAEPATEFSNGQMRAPRRRDILASAGLLAPLLFLQHPRTPGAARAAEAPVDAAGAVFTGRAAGVQFPYPGSAWITAIDRDGEGIKEKTKPTTLALVGNFNNIDTVSVLRTPLSDELRAAVVGGDPSDAAVAEALTAEFKDSPATIAFGLLGSGGSTSSGLRYHSYEFLVESCRGTVEEGVGGKIACVGPRDGMELQTISRHHVVSSVAAGGFLYTLNASCSEDRWGEMEATMRAAALGFSVGSM